MTTHDCDCDKYVEAVKKGWPQDVLDSWPISVAPVLKANDLPFGQGASAMRGEVHRYVPLPGWDGADDRVADLWREQPIPISELLGRNCLASLSKRVGIPVLTAHLIKNKTRISIADMQTTSGDP